MNTPHPRLYLAPPQRSAVVLQFPAPDRLPSAAVAFLEHGIFFAVMQVEAERLLRRIDETRAMLRRAS